MIDQHPPAPTHPPDAHLHFLRDPCCSRPVPRSVRGSRLTTSSSRRRCGRSSSRTASVVTARRSRRAELRLDARAGFVAGRRDRGARQAGRSGQEPARPGHPLRRRHQDAAEGEAGGRGHRDAHRVGEGRRAVAGRCGDQAEDRSECSTCTRGRRRTGRSSRSSGRRSRSEGSETRSMRSCSRSCERRG